MTSNNYSQNNSFDLSWLTRYRRITVIGLGVSGVGVIRTLAENNIHVHVQDSRTTPPGAQDIQQLENVDSIHFGGFDSKSILASDLLIMSPGVSLKTPEIAEAILAGIEITGDIDIVSRSTSVPIVAITGSNGKSTVTKLAGEICQAAGYDAFVGGNIGRSAMELLSTNHSYDVAILEISSFQLETTVKLSAEVAVLLNLSPDHLDRYESYEGYVSAKLKVYKGAKHIVWNREDLSLEKITLLSNKSSNSEQLISFGLDEPKSSSDFGIRKIDEESNSERKSFFAQGQQLLCATNESQLLGTHNHQNVLAALAILSTFTINNSAVQKALSHFQGLPHRMQKVRERNSVVWINDSKATNVGATQSALLGLQSPIVLIAGGQGKGGNFSELLPLIRKYVTHILLMGEDAQQMQAVWQDAAECTLVESLEIAVGIADKTAKPGDVVLLAPACASFDMFVSFVDRGEQFIQLVNDL